MNYKHILPIEATYALRYLKDFIKQTAPEVDSSVLSRPKRVFFLDAPAYGNIGDQAIAFAMESLMTDALPEYQQIEITEDKLASTINWLRKTIRKDDIICLTGGGNMGALYPRYEFARRLVLKNFSHIPIVIFPQTFDYGSDLYSSRELERAKKIYGGADRLILCARDEESYTQMKSVFPKAKVLFCPDIVLYLDYRDAYEEKNGTGICIRNDTERVLSDDQHKRLYQRYPGAARLTTMEAKSVPITYKNRRNVVERKLREFGEKELILTDRLHGTIFAFITNTPCIAFPNTNGKVERVCKYLSENGSVLFTRDVAAELAINGDRNGTVRDRFGELIDAIRSIADG